MTHGDTEQAIAKAEMIFFRKNPHRGPESVARSSVSDGRVFLHDLRGRKLAVFRIVVSRYRLTVVEETPC